MSRDEARLRINRSGGAMLALVRFWLFPVVGFVGAAVASQAPDGFPPLRAQTTAGWNQYAAATGQRVDRELKAAQGFLALDFGPSPAESRRAVLRGEMPVAEMRTTGPGGRSIEVSDAWVHHWRGAVLIRGARLDHMFKQLQESVPGTGQGDVLASAILSREGPRLRVFLKVQRSKALWTFVYNTEHLVTFARRDATRGSSTSVATKIAELSSPGTAAERERAAGSDNGFLWRWNSYWRYQQVPEGVIAECESISLSRTAPFGLGWIAGSIATSTARESMEAALINLRRSFATSARTPPASLPVR
jgi:hypothetical protein